MTPRQFRELPHGDQVEMMAHLREFNLRRAHSEHVGRIVGKMEEPGEGKGKR